MNRLKYYVEKYKIIIVLSTIILILIIILFLNCFKKNSNETNEIDKIIYEDSKEEIVEEKENNYVKVDIKGEVKKTGVYELESGSRVIDVIKLAGGLTSKANTEYINLSKKVSDEMVIIIYSNSEIDKFKTTEKDIVYIEYECNCPDNKNDACISENDIVNTNSTKEESVISSKDNKVSINNSSLEELMTLNGIGESKARAIIEYREKNNKFNTLEEIMNVSGIGEAAYSKIKDSIKL